MEIRNRFLLDKKTAIVTGAAQGLGKSTAIAFAHSGADVAVVDVDYEKASAVAEEIRGVGQKAIAIQTDVKESLQVEQMVQEVLDNFEKIDILVNCAGIFGRMAPAVDLTEKELDETIAVNVKGTFLCCQNVGREMIKRKKGKIINFGSIAGIQTPSRQNYIHYSISKAGIIMLTKCLAAEWGKYGINVNCISPGLHLTAMGSDVLGDVIDSVRESTPLKRIAEADEIGPVVVFLASDGAGYIQGHNLVDDGGRICWYY